MGSNNSAQAHPVENSNLNSMDIDRTPAVFDNTSWMDNFLDDAMDSTVTDGVNGLFHSFDEKGEISAIVPEEMMEVILGYCHVDEIRNVAAVCIRWKTITSSRSFWKPVCTRHNIPWNEIPSSIKHNSNAWIAFYAFCKHDVLKKNFVRNHSGQDGFNGWDMETSHYSQRNPPFQIEQLPIGCDHLPDDPFDDATSCFATSYTYGRKSQTIDLWKSGLTPAVMRICAPFEITLTEMTGARFDCGGTGTVSLEFEPHKSPVVEDNEDIPPNPVPMKSETFNITAGSNWETIRIVMPPVDTGLLQTFNFRYAIVSSVGKDDRFWAGYYGAKFARCCVTFKCLDLDTNPAHVPTY